MPSKRKSQPTSSSSYSSSSSSSSTSSCQDIARAVAKMAKVMETTQDGFRKQVEAYNNGHEVLQTMVSSTLQGLDENLQDRQRHLSQINDQIAYEERQGQIKIKQNLEEYGLSEARNVLAKLGKEDINVSELSDLRSELQRAQANHAEEVEKAVAEAVQKEKAINKAMVGRIEAEAKLKLAQTQAELQSKDVIIENLRQSLLKSEKALESQRVLTKEVADAASRSTTSVYTGGNSK